MTPLAHRLAKQLTLPIKDRDAPWNQRDGSELVALLSEAHFFECTEVLPLTEIIGDTSQDWFDARTFLPAPKTWIEFDNGDERRAVVLMEHPGNDKWYQAYLVLADTFIPIGLGSSNGDYYTEGGQFTVPERIGQRHGIGVREAHIAIAHTLLVLINSPHIIGRTTRTPHRGLERLLKSKYPVFGKYPLRAWSELKLEATVRHEDKHTGEISEAHLTGKKCLHFCRAHLRVRMGRLELVSSHWRGDPALGIKRTRYRIVPPKVPA